MTLNHEIQINGLTKNQISRIILKFFRDKKSIEEISAEVVKNEHIGIWNLKSARHKVVNIITAYNCQTNTLMEQLTEEEKENWMEKQTDDLMFVPAVTDKAFQEKIKLVKKVVTYWTDDCSTVGDFKNNEI